MYWKSLHGQLNVNTVSFYFSPLFFPPSDISHFQEQNDLKALLENLLQNIQSKKRKNVEIMWLAATVSTLMSNLISCHVITSKYYQFSTVQGPTSALWVTRCHLLLVHGLGIFTLVGSSIHRLEHKIEEAALKKDSCSLAILTNLGCVLHSEEVSVSFLMLRIAMSIACITQDFELLL